MIAGAGPLLLTTPPPTSGGGSAPGTNPSHAPRIPPAWGESARGCTAASRAAAGGTDPRGPDGAAREGATAPEEGAEDRGEAADLLGSLAPLKGSPPGRAPGPFFQRDPTLRPPALSWGIQEPILPGTPLGPRCLSPQRPPSSDPDL